MIFAQTQLTLKTLVLSFLCCLHVCANQVEADKEKAELLSLRVVHPQNEQLAHKVAKQEIPTPTGYQLAHLPIIDIDTNKVIDKKPILIHRRKIVTAEDVKAARATGRIGEISVLLTEKGGEKMLKVTQDMNLGHDRIAVLIESRCVIAPTVQAKLGRNFIVNGLGDKSEVKRLVRAFNK